MTSRRIGYWSRIGSPALAVLCAALLACGGDENAGGQESAAIATARAADRPPAGAGPTATPPAGLTRPTFAGATPVSSPVLQPTAAAPSPAPQATLQGPLNLVPNPSFESAAGWRLVRSNAPDASPLLDPAVARTGQSSARIDHVATGNCPAVCGYWTAPIAVTPGRQYEIGAWFRLGESLVGQSGIYVTVRVPDAAGAYQPLVGYPTGARTGEWTLATRNLSFPGQVTSIVLDISWWRNIDFPNAQGTIWLDDVFLR